MSLQFNYKHQYLNFFFFAEEHQYLNLFPQDKAQSEQARGQRLSGLQERY